MDSIYFIQKGDARLFKIGVSNNPEKTARRLGDSYGEELSVFISAHARNAEELKETIHELLIQHRIRGDWFEFDDDKVMGVAKLLVTAIADRSVEPTSGLNGAMSDKVLSLISKMGSATKRDIYTYVHGMNSDRAEEILTELESEGEIESRQIGRKTMWSLA